MLSYLDNSKYVTLRITREELHDLQVIASIPSEILQSIMHKATKPWLTAHTQTHDVYTLLESIAEIGVETWDTDDEEALPVSHT